MVEQQAEQPSAAAGKAVEAGKDVLFHDESFTFRDSTLHFPPECCITTALSLTFQPNLQPPADEVPSQNWQAIFKHLSDGSITVVDLTPLQPTRSDWTRRVLPASHCLPPAHYTLTLQIDGYTVGMPQPLVLTADDNADWLLPASDRTTESREA